MRKLIMSLFMLAGLLFAGMIPASAPASANAASGLTGAKIATAQGDVTKAGWRGHHRRGVYFGFYPSYSSGYGYYPRHRYYRHHRHHRWGWRHHHRRHHYGRRW